MWFGHKWFACSCIQLVLSNNIWHSVPSNSFPIIYPCSDIGNFSSALILLVLVISILTNYVVLKSEFPSNLVVLITSEWMPSCMSKYSPFIFFWSIAKIQI